MDLQFYINSKNSFLKNNDEITSIILCKNKIIIEGVKDKTKTVACFEKVV